MMADSSKKVKELYYRGVQIFFRHYLGYEYLFKYSGQIYNAFYDSYESAKTAVMAKVDMLIEFGDDTEIKAYRKPDETNNN